VDQFRDLTYVGEETLDGAPVHHLQATMSADALLGEEDFGTVDTGDEFAVDYWIGVDDNLIRRAIMEGTIAVESDEGDVTMEMVLTMTFYEYGKPVSISPPD
jgi:hypothetical protein